jgi:hypothetical protein
MIRHVVAASAVVLGIASAAAASVSSPRYVERVVHQGGSRFTYTFVRADDNRDRQAPYALTGTTGDTARPRAKTIPSSPRGPHSNY